MSAAKLFQILLTEMNEIFQSDRYFILHDVVASHGQLLLRSQKNMEYPFNIDVIFYGTTFVQLFSRLYSLRLSKVDKAVKDSNYETVKKYLEYDNSHLFQIESNNEMYYIAASFVVIYENQMTFSESSLNADDKGTLLAASFNE